jgi:hypothetical protein
MTTVSSWRTVGASSTVVGWVVMARIVEAGSVVAAGSRGVIRRVPRSVPERAASAHSGMMRTESPMSSAVQVVASVIPPANWARTVTQQLSGSSMSQS